MNNFLKRPLSDYYSVHASTDFNIQLLLLYMQGILPQEQESAETFLDLRN